MDPSFQTNVLTGAQNLLGRSWFPFFFFLPPIKIKLYFKWQHLLDICDLSDQAASFNYGQLWWSRKNTEVGGLSLLWGISQTQGFNPGLPHCRRIPYQLSHKESPRILEWVAYPFSRGSSQPRKQTRVSCIAGGFLTNWATREVPYHSTRSWLINQEHLS